MNVLRSRHAGMSLLGMVIVTAGCTSTLGAPEPPATSESPTCAVGGLVVSADRDGVRVTNPSAGSCRFSGRYPVRMLVWQLSGPEPPIATGVLPGGSIYVQPYIAGGSNGCPVTAERIGAVTVFVEGVGLGIPRQGQTAHEIAHCISFTAGRPRIER